MLLAQIKERPGTFDIRHEKTLDQTTSEGCERGSKRHTTCSLPQHLFGHRRTDDNSLSDAAVIKPCLSRPSCVSYTSPRCTSSSTLLLVRPHSMARLCFYLPYNTGYCPDGNSSEPGSDGGVGCTTLRKLSGSTYGTMNVPQNWIIVPTRPIQ